MKKLIDWIKPSFEGPDGKLSHRRASIFYFILLLTYMIGMTAYGSTFPEIAWIVISADAGLMSGLSVWQNKVNQTNSTNEQTS